MAVTKEILALAVEIGDALLRNGAEVYRVEDTVMHKMCIRDRPRAACRFPYHK